MSTQEPVQTEPAMDMNETSSSEKVDGIVAQTRADHPGAEPERVAEVLRQRLTDSGIELSDDEVRTLAEG